MEPSINIDFLQEMLPPTISLIVTGLLSVAIGIYLEKFRTRVSLIKYFIQYQPLATSSQNDYWGDIEVYHNKRKTNHLNFVTITIENDSNADFENLTMNVWVDTGSQILSHNGYYDDSKAIILLEQAYYNYFNEVSQKIQMDDALRAQNANHETPQQLLNEVTLIMGTKTFFLPVLNRRTNIVFNFLVENFNGLVPVVSINISHKSLKLYKRQDKNTELGLTVIYSYIIGIILYIASIAYLISLYEQSRTAIIITAINGFLCGVVGFIILKLLRSIKKMI